MTDGKAPTVAPANMPTTAPVIPAAAIAWARSLAEAAILRRLNAGVGFADRRALSQLFVRDAGTSARLASGFLRSENTHRDAAAANEKVLRLARTKFEQEVSRILLLCERFLIDTAGKDLIALCLAFEIDLDTRDLVLALARQNDSLTFETIADLLGQERIPVINQLLLPSSRLVTNQLLECDGEGLATRLRIHPFVRQWLCGNDSLSAEVASIGELTPLKHESSALLPQHVRESVETVAHSQGFADLLFVLVGARGSGRRSCATLLAARLGRRLLTISIATLLQDPRRSVALVRDTLSQARILGATVLFTDCDVLASSASEEPNQAYAALKQAIAREIAAASGAVMMSATSQAAVASVKRPFKLFRIPASSLSERVLAWQKSLRVARTVTVPATTVEYAGELAARYVLGPGAIAEIVDEACAGAALFDGTLHRNQLDEAVQRRLSLRLGAFGSIVQRKATFSELIVSDDVKASLTDMVAMVKQRSQILEGWGFAKHLGIARGVSALFAGEPGTGKTMAASVIASELGLELVRIDLSTVVSKFVGETEKNLSKIFDEAQQAHAMLLFDEADSLFGKRTELRSAQDRFANLEVNYILQRIETFDGISILTTNAENAIDQALQRRLNFRIRFPSPEPEEREQLWRSLLPPQAQTTGDIDFAALAATFVMTGGYIKNALVRAAVLAAKHGRALTAEDIYAGAHAEYSEMGKVMPQIALGATTWRGTTRSE